MKYPQALGAVILGNFIASSIMTLLCAFLPENIINYVITAIGIIAFIVVVILLIKIFTYKKPEQASDTNLENNEVK